MSKLFAFFIVVLFAAQTMAAKEEQPHSLDPEGRVEGQQALLSNNSGASAVYDVLLFGLINGMAKIFPSKDKRDDLRGNCSYGEEDKAIRSACNHVKVELLEEAKKKVVSAETNENGDFRFFIPQGKTYYVQVSDRKGRTAYVDKKVGRSDWVSILLKP